jgi:hypothetical protein
VKKPTSTAECLVSGSDYARHWEGKTTPTKANAPQPYTGPERRIGPADRRSSGHDRRFEFTRGRRYRLADRRKTRP